jgi:all-trans-8'-apo-beta-carotenal 15,15'-oxygenase
VHVEYDASRAAANVLILDAKRVQDEPVAEIQLPMHIPYSFHGAFVPKM